MRIGYQILLTAAALTSGSTAFATGQLCSGAAGPMVNPTTSAPAGSNPAAAVLGNTAAEIHTRFAGIIEQNFRAGDPNRIVHALESRELADLAAVYRAAGGQTTLLRMMAMKVDAEGLTLVAGAFGQTETAAAVEAYAPKSVLSQFKSLPVKAAAESPSVAFSTSGGNIILLDPNVASPAPSVGITAYEIYLDFRTAPVGSSGIAGSLWETAAFMATKGARAFGAGVVLGTAVNSVIVKYDPDLENAIGGTVAGVLQQIQDTTGSLLQGKYEESGDALFGQPMSFDDAGDFGVTQSMADYSSGGC